MLNQQTTYETGMTTETMYSLSSTFGGSGLGMSASISATFGQTFTIEERSNYTDMVHFEAPPEKQAVVCMWQLCDLFYIVKLASEGYSFIDEYSITVDSSGDTKDYKADRMFFGNTEKNVRGESVGTNYFTRTDLVESRVTEFPA